MKALAINCGSSTLKFEVIGLEEGMPAGREDAHMHCSSRRSLDDRPGYMGCLIKSANG